MLGARSGDALRACREPRRAPEGEGKSQAFLSGGLRKNSRKNEPRCAFSFKIFGLPARTTAAQPVACPKRRNRRGAGKIYRFFTAATRLPTAGGAGLKTI